MRTAGLLSRWGLTAHRTNSLRLVNRPDLRSFGGCVSSNISELSEKGTEFRIISSHMFSMLDAASVIGSY
jgi:hypothetical protein